MSESIDMNPCIASNITSDARSLTPFIKDKTKIPRPPNAFMIFGKEYRKMIAKKFTEYSNKQISKILGQEWKEMSAERKNYYHRLADEAHKQHLIKYPGFLLYFNSFSKT
jgi:hypothetical protein